jgi:hypothetical protein
MDQFKKTVLVLILFGIHISPCLSQNDKFHSMFPFVPKKLRISILNDSVKEGKNMSSVLTNREFNFGWKYVDHVKAIELSDLWISKVDGTQLANYKNLEILRIEIVEPRGHPISMSLTETAQRNLTRIAEGIHDLKNLKYVMVVGSNEALINELSSLNSLKSLIIYNSLNSFQSKGDWKNLRYLEYIGESGVLDFSKMDKLDSISVRMEGQSNAFASLPENSIQKVTFSGDPRKLDYSVFNPNTMKELALAIYDETSSTETIEINLIGLDSLLELKIINLNPVKWGDVSLANLEKLSLETTGHVSGAYYPSEFPFFLKSLTSLRILELDLYTDYIPKKRDFPNELTDVSLRFRRESDIRKIRFLKKLKKLRNLELSRYPITEYKQGYNTLELKGDCWLSRIENEMDLALKDGVELKRFRKIINRIHISELFLETIQVRKYLELICSNDFDTIQVVYSGIINESNEMEVVGLTDKEIERLNQCQGEALQGNSVRR